LRTYEELENIILNCPFSKEEVLEAEYSSKSKSLHVAFLTHAPSKESVERLNSYRSENEDFKIVGRDIFLLFRNSIRNSKLVTNIQKLGVPATVRNWNTTNKVATLSKDI
jgi:uncharacterized protein (DUF1697 family)